MNISTLLFARRFSLVLAIILAVSLRAEIEFVGILATPKRTQFALTDSPQKRPIG